MEVQFKHIIIVVITVLACIFAWQVYWLIGLYNSERQAMERTVKEALLVSDYGELDLRINKIRKAEGKDRQITISVNDDALGQSKRDSTVSVISLLAGMTLDDHIRKSVHAAVDIICPPNGSVFDSLLTSQLEQREIHVKHRTMYRKGNRYVVVGCSEGFSFEGKTERFSLPLSEKLHTSYVVETEPFMIPLLKQMSGILAASLLIMVVLGFVFWYLVRTMMRMKTLDEMKTDFSNSITHELKTPISVAYAANDALLNYNADSDEQRRKEYLNICRKQLEMLSGMVEQILSLSMEKRKNMRLNVVDIIVIDTIKRLASEHQLRATKPMTFSIDVEPRNLTVKADSMHFSNIISNIIDNAIKYSGESVNIAIRACTTNKGVDIEIADNGIGIEQSKLKYIFDRFYRIADGNRYTIRGYGLGLYYVRTMMEKFGGSVSVDSEKGKGTTFKLHFNG